MLDGCVPWPEEFAKRYRELGYWEGVTIFDSLSLGAEKNPNKVAIIDGERKCTYAQLVARSEAIGAGLQQLGLRRNDRVIFQMANSLELVETFYGLVRIGAIPILALPAHRSAEITHFASAVDAAAYFIPDVVRNFDYREMAREVQAQCPELRLVVVSGQAGQGQTALQELARIGSTVQPTEPGPEADDVAILLLSGGTTGRPKLIPRTHDDYLCGAKRSAQVAGMGPSTVFLAVLPMAHNYTLAAPGVVGTLAAGGTVVVAKGSTDEAVFQTIERHRVNMVCAAVPLVAKWLNSSLFGQYDLSSLKVFMNGGAKLAPELRRRVEEKFHCTYQESFGTAEGLLNQTKLDDPVQLRMESSGCPVCDGDEIKVIDENGNELPDGVPGELAVRGPYTIRGYYKAPEINTKAFTPDGFYKMGDVVRIVDGYIYLDGRKKDLINRGGEKISCEEIENYILAYKKIESACVVAMPDETFGEKACAFVITRGNGGVTLDDLTEFLQSRGIARFKFPERLEVVDVFPISPVGKILRSELRACIAEKLKAESIATSL